MDTHHFLMSYDGDTSRIYIDGNIVHSTADKINTNAKYLVFSCGGGGTNSPSILADLFIDTENAIVTEDTYDPLSYYNTRFALSNRLEQLYGYM